MARRLASDDLLVANEALANSLADIAESNSYSPVQIPIPSNAINDADYSLDEDPYVPPKPKKFHHPPGRSRTHYFFRGEPPETWSNVQQFAAPKHWLYSTASGIKKTINPAQDSFRMFQW
jgi:hypothetical protein